jgi:hypothetical protein
MKDTTAHKTTFFATHRHAVLQETETKSWRILHRPIFKKPFCKYTILIVLFALQLSSNAGISVSRTVWVTRNRYFVNRILKPLSMRGHNTPVRAKRRSTFRCDFEKTFRFNKIYTTLLHWTKNLICLCATQDVRQFSGPLTIAEIYNLNHPKRVQADANPDCLSRWVAENGGNKRPFVQYSGLRSRFRWRRASNWSKTSPTDLKCFNGRMWTAKAQSV